MSEVVLPPGAVYTGATRQALDEARAAAERSPDGYTPSVFDPATRTAVGYCRVARNRVPVGGNKQLTSDAVAKGAKQPYTGSSSDDKEKRGFNLYYEMHGKGDTHVVFIMGLNSSCFGWLNQVEHLAKDDRYTSLVFDNRGYGNSDAPGGLYRTSEMAKDVIELLDHVGWTQSRSVNLVGISMGGMISLELAKAIPERVASMTLISTTSGRGMGEKDLRISAPPLSGLKSLGRILSGRVLGFDSDQYRVNAVCEMLLPVTFLDSVDERDPKKRTNRETFQEMFAFRFEFSRRQTLHGAFSQIHAALTHRVTPTELARINDAIPKITVITGDTDNLVNPGNSKHLKKHMPKADLVILPGVGHITVVQESAKINHLLTDTLAEGKSRLEAGKW